MTQGLPGLVDSMVRLIAEALGAGLLGGQHSIIQLRWGFPTKKNEMVILTIKFNIIKLNLLHTSLWLCADLFHRDI